MTRLALLAWLACAACRSSPSRYYTLVAPAGAAGVAASNELQIEVLPVDVPPEVDRAQMVVRRGPGEVAPVDTRSWIAPLPLELRRALADALTRSLGVRDVAGLSTSAGGVPTFRIKVVIQRFESMLGERAVIDAVWTIREAGGHAPELVCSTRASEVASGDYAGLAEAHQRALGRIAAHIAAGVRAARAAQTTCPDAP